MAASVLPLAGFGHLELFPKLDAETFIITEVYLTLMFIMLCGCLWKEQGRRRLVWSLVIVFMPLGFVAYLWSILRRQPSQLR